jgi:hypothetical protein
MDEISSSKALDFKHARRIKYEAPGKSCAKLPCCRLYKCLYISGLNLFTDPFLANFSANNLNLESDFNYKAKRARLQQIGLDKETIEDILSNKKPLVFLNRLNAEACSVLVSDENDFCKICDFIFFYCSSCFDEMMFELYTKALFDLLKNYDFRWKLKLRHVLTCLENLGLNAKITTDANGHFNNNIKSRLEVVEKAQKAKGKKSFEYTLPKSQGFVLERKKKVIEVKKNLLLFTCSDANNDSYLYL